VASTLCLRFVLSANAFVLIVRLLTKCWLKTAQVKLYGPNGAGYTRATSIISLVSAFAKTNKYRKPGLGSDCFLKLKSMRVESLVIVNENVAVNRIPIFVHTARHVMGVDCV